MIDAFNAWLDSLNWLQQIYSAMAFAGALIFIVQLVLSFVGHGLEDQPGVVSDLGASDFSFRFASLQTIAAFLWIAGMFGLYTDLQTGSHVISVIAGTLCGLLASYLVYKLKKMILKLQSNGAIVINKAIGHEATVYLKIPANGVGQVELVLQERKVFQKAVSKDKKELATGSRAKIVEVTSDSILVVEQA